MAWLILLLMIYINFNYQQANGNSMSCREGQRGYLWLWTSPSTVWHLHTGKQSNDDYQPGKQPPHPQSIFIGFELPCSFFPGFPLAPHTQGTPNKKSILSTGQCHHNYSSQTAIEDKLHLHCLFTRSLRLSRALPLHSSLLSPLSPRADEGYRGSGKMCVLQSHKTFQKKPQLKGIACYLSLFFLFRFYNCKVPLGSWKGLYNVPCIIGIGNRGSNPFDPYRI